MSDGTPEEKHDKAIRQALDPVVEERDRLKAENEQISAGAAALRQFMENLLKLACFYHSMPLKAKAKEIAAILDDTTADADFLARLKAAEKVVEAALLWRDACNAYHMTAHHPDNADKRAAMRTEVDGYALNLDAALAEWEGK